MKYKVKPYDVVNDIWIIYERVFFIFWRNIGVGTREKCEKYVKDNEKL